MNRKDIQNLYPDSFFTLMLSLNALITVFFLSTMQHASRGYLSQGMARDFLKNVSRVPMAPGRVILLALIPLGILAFFLLNRRESESSAQAALRLFMEMVLVFMLCFALGLSYNGIVFLLLADVMRSRLSLRGRIGSIVLFSLFYFLLDSFAFRQTLHVTDASIYWQYYRQDVMALFVQIRDILHLLNILVFILFMVTQLQMEMSEKEQILALNEELKKANQKLELYAEEAVRTAQTSERNRLAREIHDTLGHSLTAIIAGMEACAVLMDISPEASKKQMQAIAQVARDGMTDVRASVSALRPDALQSLPVNEALEKLIGESRLSTGVDISYSCSASFQGLGQDEEEALYRVVQESITNAIRHGRADKIEISISRDYNRLRIHIHDNGTGCEKIEEGFGLHHMRERLGLLGGSLCCDGSDGFTIDAFVPIRWGVEDGGKNQDPDRR